MTVGSFGSFRRWMLLAGVVLAAACGGDSTGPGGGGGGSNVGMPDPNNPFSHPTGPAYNLPAGLEIVGKIRGAADYDDGDSTHTCVATDTVGHGVGYVNLCIHLHNSGGTPITITLPPGLIFVNHGDTTQNGVNIWTEEITIPAGVDMPVLLQLFCGNLSRHATAGGEEYTIGPVFDNAELAKLADLLAPKVRDPASADVAQELIWEIGETGKLSDDSRDIVNALPNR